MSRQLPRESAENGAPTSQTPASWTTIERLRSSLQSRWDRGIFLRGWLEGGEISTFPLRVRLKGPARAELAEQYEAVRRWIAPFDAHCGSRDFPAGTSNLQGEVLDFEVEWIDIEHRILGRNRLPAAALFGSLELLAKFTHRTPQLQRFRQNAAALLVEFPDLRPWALQHPRELLLPPDELQPCLQVARWMRAHPTPGIYLRELALPGIDTKFVETHRTLLKQWSAYSEFLPKPLLVRCRLLDPAQQPSGFSDITLRADEFAHWAPAITTWFVVENDTTALAFPPCADTAVLFGRGYGFDALRPATWLRDKELHYWGDIDTHGFAILDQFRALFPKARSLLMDRVTLLECRSSWVTEPSPTHVQLTRLTSEESALYAELQADQHAPSLRLEQEFIPFDRLQRALAELQRLRTAGPL
jgi:hypothetical protein